MRTYTFESKKGHRVLSEIRMVKSMVEPLPEGAIEDLVLCDGDLLKAIGLYHYDIRYQRPAHSESLIRTEYVLRGAETGENGGAAWTMVKGDAKKVLTHLMKQMPVQSGSTLQEVRE
jgi:hypothetical protein